MRNLTIYHDNAINSAVLSGGNWQPNLPLANLYSPRTTKRARSVTTQAEDTQFRVSLSEGVLFYGIQVISTNLSSAGLYRISWYSDAAFTALVGQTPFIAVGLSIDWTNTDEWFAWESPNFWLGAVPFSDPDNQGRDIRHTFSTPIIAQYLKFELDDTTNSEGFIELGYLYIGKAFIPSINVDPEPQFARVSLTSVQEAVGGGQFFNRRGSRKKLQITWAVLSKTEVMGDLDEIIRIHDVDKPVYVDLDPEDTDLGRKTAFLARLSQLPEAKLLQAYLENDTAATIGFEFIQVL